MTFEESIRAISDYEISHPVEEYRFYDWNVWPLLRTIVGFAACEPSPQYGIFSLRGFAEELSKRSPLFLGAARRVKRMMSIVQGNSVKNVDAEHNDDFTATGREVVILTMSGRRQQLGNCLYEIYADPVVEHLDQLNVRSVVWERYQERWPRCLRSVWISRLLALELLKAPALPGLVEPAWFRDFTLFAHSVTGRRFRWRDIDKPIRYLQQESLIFEKWLRKTSPKLLISVCWYDPEIMAAILASKRLGIISVDLQHGSQTADHFAYDLWQKVPDHAFEIVPDIFWCWGKGQAQRLMERNPAFARQSKAVVGGNLWFNKWRVGHDCFSHVGFEKLKQSASLHKMRILVTLQPGLENSRIIDIMKGAPEDWFWLLRFHPATPEKEKKAQKEMLSAIPSDRFECDVASAAPLYSLLAISNVHITGNSTCALEALGFGIPSVIVTKDGVSAFREYIADGIMLQANDSDDIISMIRMSQTIEKARCVEASYRIFASEEESRRNIFSLMDHARITAKNMC